MKRFVLVALLVCWAYPVSAGDHKADNDKGSAQFYVTPWHFDTFELQGPSKTLAARVHVGCMVLDEGPAQRCDDIARQILHTVDAAEQNALACTTLRKQHQHKEAQRPCVAALKGFNKFMTLQKELYVTYPSVRAFFKKNPFYYT